MTSENRTPLLFARGLVKRYGRVTALDHADFDLYPGEIIVVPSTVLSAVNNFLSDLLNPVTRAASAASIGAGF